MYGAGPHQKKMLNLVWEKEGQGTKEPDSEQRI